MEDNTWYAVRKQSLAIAARNAGFDLAIYHQYSENVREELRKRAIKAAMEEIRIAFNGQTDEELADLKKGLYVISLTVPLTVEYKNKHSEVIYIGIGDVESRIKSHFNNSLFDFMQSLSGADFDFRFSRPNLKLKPKYYKHVEYLMLEYFRKSTGELPILNKNAGSKCKIIHNDYWWNTPLKGSGKKPRWALTALPDSGFQKLV
jgi:hypothetical protein